MSNFTYYRERSRDTQDHIERHVWGEQKYTGKGSIIKVRGTDSQDEETAVLNIGGNSFNLKKDANSEVFLLSGGSDTTLKLAVLTIPKDKQRRWPENSGGVQHPNDPDFAFHIEDKMAHVTKNKFAVGEKGEFEIKGDQGVFRVSKLIVDGELVVNKKITTPEVVNGSENPPGFDGTKQAEVSKDDGASQAQYELGFGT